MSWHNKTSGAYGRTSTDAQENAQEAYNVLNSLGWCLEAVCALLGNVEHESGYNPWRWQSDNIITSTDTYHINNQTGHAYGFCQQDPAGKYINSAFAQIQYGYGPNFSDITGNINDCNAQLRYIHNICSDTSSSEWQPNSSYAQGLGLQFVDFIANTPSYTVAQLTRTFFGCYERGTWSQTRVEAAEYWQTYLGGYTPTPPPGGNAYAAWFGVFRIIAKRRNATVLYRHKNKPGGGFQ